MYLTNVNNVDIISNIKVIFMKGAINYVSINARNLKRR